VLGGGGGVGMMRNSGWRWQVVVDHPVAVETLDQVQELFVAGGLDEIGVGAEVIGVVDGFNAGVAGEDNDH